MQTYRIKHVGINCENAQEAKAVVDLFCNIFGVEQEKDDDKKVFAGTLFEIMKHGGPGVHGHIALQTDDVNAAITELKAKGVEFDEDTIRYNAEGKAIFGYLKHQISGFAIHLIE